MTDLNRVIRKINKRFGENTIGKIGKMPTIKTERVSSGSPYLDWAIGGGWPLGKTIELYGPYSSGKSLIALRTIVQAQKLNKRCVYLDAENAFDPNFAKLVGVDVDNLTISQISAGEEVFDIVDMLLESDVSIIVIDSIAALVPKYEIEESIEKQTMALQARLMSKALRKLTGKAAKNKTLIFFVNQIREKLGCFQYYTRIVLENGKTAKIGYLVNNKIKCNVLSYNVEKNTIEPTPITNWFTNGNADYFLHFRFRKPQGRGKGELSCTPDHKIMVKPGIYKKAKDIKVGDKILTVINDWIPSNIQKEILIGGLLGDGCLRKVGREKYQYRETHCKEQDDYIRWKSSYFDTKTMGRHKYGGLYFETFLSTIFEQQYIKFYLGGKKVKVPKDIKLTPLILAIWYQDDGYLTGNKKSGKKSINLCTNSFRLQSIKNLQIALKEQFNIETGTKTRKHNSEIELTLGRKDTLKFFEICKYLIHPSMYYKLPSYLLLDRIEYMDMKVMRWKFDPPQYEYEKKELITKYAYVTHKYNKPQTRSMVKFDIETKNHNYLADGAIVHNSYGNPEITSGGRSLGFYASLRVEVRRGEFLTDNKRKIGQQVKFKVTKSKVCQPYRDGYFLFYYPDLKNPDLELFDNADELVSMLLLHGKIKRRGSYYDVLGETFQGREELESEIRSNKKFRVKLKKL